MIALNRCLSARVTIPADNPFSTCFVRPENGNYRFPNGRNAYETGERLLQLLKRSGTAAIIGQHGTGKSTLLQTLAEPLHQEFDRLKWVQLTRFSDNRPAVDSVRRFLAAHRSNRYRCCLIIDGFEQLGWAERFRLVAPTRAARFCWRAPANRHLGPSLVVTAHRPQLGISTFYRTGWCDEVVDAMTTDKLSELSPAERETMLQVAAQRKVTARHGQNVRDYWFMLYDEYERLRSRDGQPGEWQ